MTWVAQVRPNRSLNFVVVADVPHCAMVAGVDSLLHELGSLLWVTVHGAEFGVGELSRGIPLFSRPLQLQLHSSVLRAAVSLRRCCKLVDSRNVRHTVLVL